MHDCKNYRSKNTVIILIINYLQVIKYNYSLSVKEM